MNVKVPATDAGTWNALNGLMAWAEECDRRGISITDQLVAFYTQDYLHVGTANHLGKPVVDEAKVLAKSFFEREWAKSTGATR